MEFLGAMVFGILMVAGLFFFAKNSRNLGWWINTKYYNKDYQKKMLTRTIEDAQDELAQLDKE